MSTRSLNKVMLIGNLTRDPQVRYTAKGTPVASVGIATNRSYTDSSGNKVESAEFTNIVAWAKLAEIFGQLLKKGMKVYIEGRLNTNKWEDQASGQTKYRTEVVATDMFILSSSNNDSGDYDSNDENNEEEDINFDELSDDDNDDKDKGSDNEDNETPF